MPLVRPTLPELVARIVGDVDTRLPLLFARVPQNPANVFCESVAGLTHGAYGYIDQQLEQVLPTKATGKYLADWGRVTGVDRNVATKAVVPVSISVTTNPTTIPDGTVYRRTDGTLYETTEELTANSNPFAFEVTAQEEGEAGTVTIGTVLAIGAFIAGIGTTATATADGEGEDLETEEDWRARILEKLRSTPQGGADVDYIQWAKEVEGVGNAWVIPQTPPFVNVLIISNDEEDLEADAPLVAAVLAYIEDGRRPVNAVVSVNSATIVEQAFTFTTLTPNTMPVQDAVDAALSELLATVREPGGTLQRNAVIAAVQNTGVVTTFVMSVPAANVVYGVSEIPTLGVTTYP